MYNFWLNWVFIKLFNDLNDLSEQNYKVPELDLGCSKLTITKSWYTLNIVKWIGITGSWRHTTKELKQDVKREVAIVLARGDGIVTGGALGVDYLATEVTINLNPSLSCLKIFLPTDFMSYAAHYYKRAHEGVITVSQAKKLVQQLKLVQKTRPGALIEGKQGQAINQASYYARNRLVAIASDELLAFQVNNSPGTSYTVEVAHQLGKRVSLFSYKKSIPN